MVKNHIELELERVIPSFLPSLSCDQGDSFGMETKSCHEPLPKKLFDDFPLLLNYLNPYHSKVVGVLSSNHRTHSSQFKQ